MWTYEFDDIGGSECCSSAFIIYRDKVEMFRLDVGDYDDGNKPQLKTMKSGDYWAWRTRRCPVAEQTAKLICQRLNA